MKILPKTTRLPDHALSRRHQPAAGYYTTYRDCCRWELGFTCCFCFLHETDLVEGGAEATGLIWIEHHVAKSVDPAKRDSYANCLLSCRFCNNGRNAMPTIDHSTGARLLEPTTVAWATRFHLSGDAMSPRSPKEDDADAHYTFRAYGLGAARKTTLRRIRRERMETLARTEAGVRSIVPELQRKMAKTPPKDRKAFVETIRSLREAHKDALREALRYTPIPVDSPHSCRCDEPDMTLPLWLESQLVDVDGVEVAY